MDCITRAGINTLPWDLYWFLVTSFGTRQIFIVLYSKKIGQLLECFLCNGAFDSNLFNQVKNDYELKSFNILVINFSSRLLPLSRKADFVCSYYGIIYL